MVEVSLSGKWGGEGYRGGLGSADFEQSLGAPGGASRS